MFAVYTTGIYQDEGLPVKTLELADAVAKDEGLSAEDKVVALNAGLKKAVRGVSRYYLERVTCALN